VERRTFLVRLGQTLVATPVLAQTWGCGSEDNPAAPGGGGTTEFTVTSSSNGGHTHATTFTCTALNGGTMVFTSTNVGGHTHTVTLDNAQVMQILSGTSVMVTSSLDNGHTHTWTIQKPTGVCP